MGILEKGQKGFTIIEVMLFLAVSGALAAGVLGSSSVAINNQRYVDATNSFKSLIQGEMVASTRVVNDASEKTSCLWDQVYNGSSEKQAIGTSDCVIMGRALGVKNGQDVITTNIIGKPASSSDVYANDTEAINAFRPIIDGTNQKNTELNWDTHIKNNESFIVYILRSPQSGNIVIRTQRSIAPSLFENRMASGYKIPAISSLDAGTQNICVDASGLTVAQQQTVIINANTSGPSGIEQRTGQAGCL